MNLTSFLASIGFYGGTIAIIVAALMLVRLLVMKYRDRSFSLIHSKVFWLALTAIISVIVFYGFILTPVILYHMYFR